MACYSSSAKGSSSKCDDANDEVHCCPMCMDAYDAVDKVPKMLTCGHTFCLPCINRVVKAKVSVVGRVRYTYQVGVGCLFVVVICT